MMIQRETLKNDYELHTIWQTEPKEGLPEPAFNIRDYDDGLLGIKQGKNEIVINHETLPELIKVLKYYQKKNREGA